MKALNSVSSTIEKACEIAYLIYPGVNINSSDWSAIKTGMLGKMDLFKNLLNFDVSATKDAGAKKAQAKVDKFKKENKLDSDEQLLAFVKSSSNDAASLFKWASCSLGAYWIFKDVEPKRKKAEAMRKAKIEGERQLKDTKEKVAKLTADCAQLSKTMKEKQDELDGYIKESNEMTRKLNAAS